MNQIIKNIKQRRSIRRYLDKKIPKKIIDEIIEAGRYAPSSHNSQPWRFIIVSKKSKIKELSNKVKAWYTFLSRWEFLIRIFVKIQKINASAKRKLLSDKDMFFYDAPILILICSKPKRFYRQDCSCAAQNMMLAARSLGIGSCWIGFADVAFNYNPRLSMSVGVPKDHKVVASLVFGYPEKFPSSTHPRKKEADVIN
jgi:nitroreductase